MTEPGEKKLVPVDATSEEAAGELLPLIAELREAGDFHPVARQGRWMLGRVPAMAGRIGVIFGLGALVYMHFATQHTGWRASENALMAACYLFLPLWGVAIVGGHRDAVLEDAPQGPVALLRRWGGTMLRFVPLQLVYLFFVSATLPRIVWFQFAWRPWTAISLLLLASLSWGYTVCEHVLAGRPLVDAAFRGPWLALRDLVLLPVRGVRWLRAPRLKTLSSGRLPLVAYFLLIWGLALACGLGVVWFLPRDWLRGLMGSWMLYRPLEDLALIAGAALGYEIGVGVSTYNYLACLADERPALPEESGT